jgi:hypothetical protein
MNQQVGDPLIRALENPQMDAEMMVIARIMEILFRYAAGKEAKIRALQYVMDRISMATSE